MNWSHFQTEIYEAFEHGGESLLIEAVAGSGKTRTLEELARIMGEKMPGLRGVMVAFNKSIAQELQARIDKYGFRNVQAMTLHSAGWSAWRRAGGLDWTPGPPDNLKTVKIMREVLSYEENKQFGETTRKLVGYAKGIGIVPHDDGEQSVMLGTNGELHDHVHFERSSCGSDVPCMQVRGLVPDTEATWEGLMDHYSLDAEDCNIDCVRRVLARGIELARETCDFPDMIYMPLIAGVPFDKYDVVFVDEAQDLSAVDHEIVGRMSRDRVVACGDRGQAIYAFKGAMSNSMDAMKERFQMTELPLSVSYRCPQDVVSWAQQWVPQIEWADTADFGFVGKEGTDWKGQAEIALEGISKWKGIADFQPGDAILCRLTRPLVAAAFTLIRGRVACRVLGRAIGKGLVDLIRKAKSPQDAHLREFEAWLDDYESKQVERLRSKGKHAQAGLLVDKTDTIRVFMEDLGPDAWVEELIVDIEKLFVDNGGSAGMVTLATVHKSKGLQWSRVFILDAGDLMPCPWARGNGWEMQQEKNLQYVAATRTMKELRYITTSDLKG